MSDLAQSTPTDRGATKAFFRSPTLRLVLVATLVLALLITLMMVRGLVSEREQRYNTVVSEIAALWGGEQLVGGPLLTVPYRVVQEDDDGNRRWSLRDLHVLPARLEIDATLEPQRRNRGIYEVVVYELDLTIRGEIEPPGPESWPVPAEDLLWSDRVSRASHENASWPPPTRTWRLTPL